MNTTLAKVLHVAGVTAFCTFLGCWALLARQSSAQDETTTKKSNGASDEAFVRNAAEGNMAEVKLGQLAEEKGSSETVKNFGKKMVQDHGKANEELERIAKQEGINLPTDVSRKDAATYDSLSKLSGPAFDKAYARDMVRDHEHDVAEFRQEANSGKKDAVKTFASQTLPTLEDHLKHAKQME